MVRLRSDGRAKFVTWCNCEATAGRRAGRRECAEALHTDRRLSTLLLHGRWWRASGACPRTVWSGGGAPQVPPRSAFTRGASVVGAGAYPASGRPPAWRMPTQVSEAQL